MRCRSTKKFSEVSYSGIVWLVYLETWVKTYLNLTLVVKSQLLYRQQTYSKYQETLFDLCVKLKKQGLGYRKISQKLTKLGYKSVRGKELKNNHIFSIIKKGKIRRERIKSLKSHKDYEYEIKDLSLEFRELDD